MLTDIELKEKLIAKISSTEDSELLSEISRLIDLEEQMEDVYQLSPEETNAVNEGLDQIKNGLYFSHEESNKRADEWLKKYDGR
jgi:predicted transcriptional regulator